MARYIKTLPSPDGKTRGDTYLRNQGTIRDETNLIAVITKDLNESIKIFTNQLIRDREKLLNFPHRKNNPVAEMAIEAYHSLIIQMAVMSNKLAMVENSTLQISLAAQENAQIVDDNLNLPTGLESEMSNNLAQLIEQINELQIEIQSLRDYQENER